MHFSTDINQLTKKYAHYSTVYTISLCATLKYRGHIGLVILKVLHRYLTAKPQLLQCSLTGKSPKFINLIIMIQSLVTVWNFLQCHSNGDTINYITCRAIA